MARNKKPRRAYCVLALLIPYLYFGIRIIIYERGRVKCTSRWYYRPYSGYLQDNATLPEPARSFDNRFCAGENHGLYCLLATLWMGFAITIFRILRGAKTKGVKYLHVLMNIFTIALFGMGMYAIYDLGNSITFTYKNFHGMGGELALGSICLQFVGGFFVFIYLLENCKLRLGFAPFHDMFGVWIYIICVASCISGKQRARSDYLNGNTEDFDWNAYLGFAIILIIIISPYFEWDLVGRL